MTEDELNRIAARADLSRLLAACYYQPAPEFIEEDVFGSLATAAAGIDDDLAKLAGSLGAAFVAQELLPLQVDYTRLFMNPAGPLAPPYESAWVGGNDPMRAQQTIEAVLAAYHAGGHDVDAGFRDLPDHIAAQLEFVYALIYREARAHALRDGAAEREAAERRRGFLESHLGRWVGPFSAAMQAGAETPFYRALAELTERFVTGERTPDSLLSR